MNNSYSLLQKIQQIRQDRETGTLSLERNEEVIRMFFRDGLIDAVSSSLETHRLGGYLVREGFINASALKSLLRYARRHRISVGEAAVRRKIAEPAEVSELACKQAAELFGHALDNDFAVRSFEGSSPAFHLPIRIELDYLMLELARSNSSTLKLAPGSVIVWKNGRELPSLPWYPQELSVLGELGQSRTLAELASATGLEYERLEKILSVFQRLDWIEVADAAAGGTTAIAIREPRPFEFSVPAVRSTAFSDKLEVRHNEGSFISEQFKTLKVRLGEIRSGQAIKAIAVSSPEAEDGKSLVCANLAFCLSNDPGRRVIVIDCDLRRPNLHRMLGISLDPGLAGYLGNGRLHPRCYTRRADKLYVMTAGSFASNPVELLSLDKMRQLLEYLKTEFDTILLDATPLVPISDARLVARLADALVMVARCGKTPIRSIERALASVDRAKLLGVVFNDVKARMFHTEYKHSYYVYGSRGLYPPSARASRGPVKNYLER